MKKLLFFLMLPLSIIAQKLPEFGISRVRIIEPEKTIVAEVHPVTRSVKSSASKLYFWYGSNLIHTTQGGYSGKPLNGKYSEYYNNKNLKEQGSFQNGLKDGSWKSWSETGTLFQVVTWKKGVLTGPFIIFKADGMPRQKGSYQDNILNGESITYTGKDSGVVVIYKDGRLEPTSKHRPFWKRLPFRKGSRDTTIVNL